MDREILKKFMRTTILILILMSLSVLSPSNNPVGGNDVPNEAIRSSPPNFIKSQATTSFPLALIPHDPISITSDADFSAFPGSGTVNDPYIIEGYNITTTSTNGISVIGTTKYFVIRNCYIDANSRGIFINGIAAGTAKIISNVLVKSYYGVVASYTDSVTVTNNTFINKEMGLYMYHSHSFNITDNTFISSTVGIKAYYSNSSIIVNNTFTDDIYGLSFYNSDTPIIENNNFFNCGIYISKNTLESYKSYIVNNNKVNNKPLGFFIDLQNTKINQPDYGQLILINCSNVTIANQIIDKATAAITAHYSTNLYITNNTCTDNVFGIFSYETNSSSIVRNNCTNNRYGIYFDSTYLINITRNSCANNEDYGIALYSSSYLKLIENMLLDNNQHGIRTELCENSTLYHNIFINNNIGGTSQAYDNTGKNVWYNEELEEGNYWSDWSGTGTYSIEVAGLAYDLYPIIDIDHDGLDESTELLEHNTDPFSNDTDGDGMPDGWEVKYNLDPTSNDANNDTDNDGLTNIQEYNHNTDPIKVDSDNDGLNDGQEVNVYDTDPAKIDSDGDGVTDGQEVIIYGTDPSKNDSDGDGLTDGQEVNVYGTSPTKIDTDNDGLNDYEEVNTYYTDPTKADTDGDGYSDYQEIEAGTDPLDPQDHPEFSTTNTALNTTSAGGIFAFFDTFTLSLASLALSLLNLIILSFYVFKSRKR